MASQNGRDTVTQDMLYEAITIGPQFPPTMSPEVNALQNVFRKLLMYYIPCVVIAGVFGNVLSGFLLERTVLARRSSTRYFIGIFTAHTVHLCVLFHMWLTEFDINLYNVGGWCQFTEFVNHLSAFLSLWYVVCLAADRYIAACRPERAAKMCTVFRAKAVLIALAVTGTVVYLNISLTVGVMPVRSKRICAVLDQFMRMRAQLKKCDLLINALLPAAAIMTLLVLTIVRLTRNRAQGPSGNQRAESTALTGGVKPSLASESRHAIVFLLTFLLLFLPLQILRSVHEVKALTNNSQSDLLKSLLWDRILQFVLYLQYSVNLPVLLCSQPLVRTECCRITRSMFTHLACKHRHLPVSTTKQNSLNTDSETTAEKHAI